MFQNDKKKERAPQMGDKITPKNGHCVREVDGKYSLWNEILRNIPSGNIKSIQTHTLKKGTETESEEGQIEDQNENVF